MPHGLQLDAWQGGFVTRVFLDDFQERFRERIAFALEELGLGAEELERDVLPRSWGGCRRDRFAQDEGGCAVELELGGVFEVGFGGVQDHEEDVGFQELEQCVAFEDDVHGCLG